MHFQNIALHIQGEELAFAVANQVSQILVEGERLNKAEVDMVLGHVVAQESLATLDREEEFPDILVDFTNNDLLLQLIFASLGNKDAKVLATFGELDERLPDAVKDKFILGIDATVVPVEQFQNEPFRIFFVNLFETGIFKPATQVVRCDFIILSFGEDTPEQLNAMVSELRGENRVQNVRCRHLKFKSILLHV
jgi:hypothetical protein